MMIVCIKKTNDKDNMPHAQVFSKFGYFEITTK